MFFHSPYGTLLPLFRTYIVSYCLKTWFYLISLFKILNSKPINRVTVTGRINILHLCYLFILAASTSREEQLSQ